MNSEVVFTWARNDLFTWVGSNLAWSLLATLGAWLYARHKHRVTKIFPLLLGGTISFLSMPLMYKLGVILDAPTAESITWAYFAPIILGGAATLLNTFGIFDHLGDEHWVKQIARALEAGATLMAFLSIIVGIFVGVIALTNVRWHDLLSFSVMNMRTG